MSSSTPSAAFSRRSRLRASLASCLALRWSSLARLFERNRAMDISLPGDSGRVHGASARLDSARSACERDPMSPPERAELLALMDANMVAVYAADTRATPGGAVAETPGLVMCRTPYGTVATNMAIVTGRIDAPTIRAWTLAFYGPTGSPFSVWTREHAARGRRSLHGARRGWHRMGRHPARGVRARLRPGGHLGGDRGGAASWRALHEPPGLAHGRADVPPHGLHDPDALPLVPGHDVKARPARIFPRLVVGGWRVTL